LRADYEVAQLGVSYDAGALVQGVREAEPDLVFNLYEGTAEEGNSEAQVAGVLELLGVPFTGSPSLALWLGRNKPLAKTLLRGARVPTPDFLVVEQLPLKDYPGRWPVIVKPALQDASVGIDQDSVVTNRRQLRDRLEYVLAQYGPPVLVERFIHGREFNLSLVELPELTLLPIGEIQFTDEELWPIVSYDAKWKPGTRDFVATPPTFPEDLGVQLPADLWALAVRAYRLVGCRDYARIDFRVSPEGKPFVLEVNPNPCISPLGGLAHSLEQMRVTHEAFVLDVVRTALARGRQPAQLVPS
jgi:D-alanine-D-alanine ligase